LITLFAIGQDDKTLTEKTVSQTKIKEHIYFLTDDTLKGRETGTPELKKAAAYLADQFESYGLKPNPETGNYYQNVPFTQTAPPSSTTLSLNNEPVTDFAVLSGAKVDSEKSVYLGYGLEADYEGQDVLGKIVVTKAGNAEARDTRAAYSLRQTKQQLALSNGAVALIELLDAKEQMWSFVSDNFSRTSISLKDPEGTANEEFAYVWVLDPQGTMASSFDSGEFQTASLNMSGASINDVVSYNVVGIVEGSDPVLKEEYVIYSAHYDHVGIGTPDIKGDSIYNGARDNAIGTTTVLSMAENLAKYPTKRSAVFILFTAEEKGLLGSRYYVDHPILPLSQMVYCFNSDNGGYNDTSLATIVGLSRTTAEKHIIEGARTYGLKAIDDPAGEQGLFDRSDNVNFARQGIPAPTYSLGFSAFDDEITKYYHRPGDEADTLDYDYLLKFFQSYVLSGRLIGNDPETPRWTKGDKYEAAAMELYKSE
jgi:aminopeptidase YwaD